MLSPKLRGVVFALNCYLASILALYVAFSLDLPNPWWAMLTVFLTSQPLAGAVWAKAVYRVIGTVIGVVVALVIIPNLSDSPELMILAVVAWLALCLYGSLLDRTPRAYTFMLAGYTVALVGLPLATNPIGIFDVAVARGEEIVIGVLSTALVHGLIFPLSVATILKAKLTATVNDARIWMARSLRTLPPDAGAPPARRIASDVTELSLLATNLAFEGNLPGAGRHVIRALEDRLIALLPLTTAIEDRLLALQAQGPLPPQIAETAEAVAHWIETVHPPADASAERMIADARALAPPVHEHSSWTDVLAVNLAGRLAELIQAWADCLALAATVRDSTQRPDPSVQRLLVDHGPRALHVDHGVAALSALTAAATVIACAIFTIATHWTDGPVAIGVAAVIVSLFATFDDPTPMARSIVTWILVSLPLAAFYVFAILPAIDGYILLAIVLFPVLFGIGLYLAQPLHTLKALPMAIGISSGLALQPTFRSDFATFWNLNAAAVIGGIFGLVALTLMRVIPVERVARRILRAGWRDLGALTVATNPPNRRVWVSRMLDRLGLLLPRLMRIAPHETLELCDALNDLRIGVNVLDLRSVRGEADRPTQAKIDSVLAGLSTHFRRRGVGLPDPLDPALIEDLDAAIAGTMRSCTPQARMLGVAAAVGLRRSLFPKAPAYEPPGEAA